MKQIKWLIFYVLILLLIPKVNYSQTITNEGTDFWMAFTETHDSTTAQYEIIITSKVITTGSVSIPGTGFSIPFTTIPGNAISILIPSWVASLTSSEVIENKGIHIVSLNPIVAYASTSHRYRSDASLILPTIALGTEYLIMSSPTIFLGGSIKESLFNIIGTGPSTNIQITPSANTRGGHFAGVPFTITLGQGQVYQVKGNLLGDDLTGTEVVSLNGVPFAVYSGHVFSGIICFSSGDPLFEVNYPIKSWGKEYIVPTTPGRTLDAFRVLASENNTQVLFNGTPLTILNKGDFYYDTLSQDALITANKPISVGLFLGTKSCSGGGQSDPSLIILNSNEQMSLDSITFFTLSKYDIRTVFVEVITRTIDTSFIRLNGVPVSGFTVFVHDTNYSYKKIQILKNTAYNLTSSSQCGGMIAYVIGKGPFESYAYAAGVSVVDLNSSFSWTSSSGSGIFCSSDSILFSSSTQGETKAIRWDFGDGTSDTIKNPKHIYSNGGNYLVQLIIDYPCQSDTITDTIKIKTLPLDIGRDTILCLAGNVLLDAKRHPNAKYLWSTGDTSQTIVVESSGVYTVIIQDSFCISFDTISVIIPLTPLVPNIFTPNEDGINDEFSLRGLNICENMRLLIYNRWGNLVFETEDPRNVFWDGTDIKGRKVSDGVYFFILKGEKDSELKGKITLIR